MRAGTASTRSALLPSLDRSDSRPEVQVGSPLEVMVQEDRATTGAVASTTPVTAADAKVTRRHA